MIIQVMQEVAQSGLAFLGLVQGLAGITAEQAQHFCLQAGGRFHGAPVFGMVAGSSDGQLHGSGLIAAGAYFIVPAAVAAGGLEGDLLFNSMAQSGDGFHVHAQALGAAAFTIQIVVTIFGAGSSLANHLLCGQMAQRTNIHAGFLETAHRALLALPAVFGAGGINGSIYHLMLQPGNGTGFDHLTGQVTDICIGAFLGAGGLHFHNAHQRMIAGGRNGRRFILQFGFANGADSHVPAVIAAGGFFAQNFHRLMIAGDMTVPGFGIGAVFALHVLFTDLLAGGLHLVIQHQFMGNLGKRAAADHVAGKQADFIIGARGGAGGCLYGFLFGLGMIAGSRDSGGLFIQGCAAHAAHTHIPPISAAGGFLTQRFGKGVAGIILANGFYLERAHAALFQLVAHFGAGHRPVFHNDHLMVAGSAIPVFTQRLARSFAILFFFIIGFAVGGFAHHAPGHGMIAGGSDGEFGANDGAAAITAQLVIPALIAAGGFIAD